MKILSYNIYGIKDTTSPIPEWNIRQRNLEKILNSELKDNSIKLCCLQEVNKNNIELLERTLTKNDFVILKKFPMKTELYNQYNIIAIKKDENINLKYVYCLPHGSDQKYKNIKEQIIDYGMSDYRTTVFAYFEYEYKKYLIGNIHTDYISTEGKIKGILKSLNYMDSVDCDYKIIVGDMNMVSHMSEVYNILKQNNNYTTLSRNKNFDVTDNSAHCYGMKEQVNVDFAFVEKNMIDFYEYRIVKQENMLDEGSDHRPIIISIN